MLSGADLRWAEEIAVRLHQRLGCHRWLFPDFAQEARIALWRTAQKTGLTGRRLRHRARQRIHGALIDYIRRRLGRPGSGRSLLHEHSISLHDTFERRHPKGEPAPLCLVSREEDPARVVELRDSVAFILCRCTPQVRAALQILAAGGSYEEAGEVVGRSAYWIFTKLRELRQTYPALAPEGRSHE